jgi:spoIIIJ-associated protein
VAEIIEAGSAAARAGSGAQNTSDNDRRAATVAAAAGSGRDELAGDGVGAMDGMDGTAESNGMASAEGSAGNGIAATGRPEELLVREGDLAGDYLERLLDLLDYDGDIDLDVEAGRAIVSIDGGDDLQKLVGQNGVVLEALQELTRLAVQQETGVRSRLMLDVAQWRAGRRTELAEIGRDAARRALSSGNSVKLAPMTPFERKIVHDAVAKVSGVHSESEGEEPRRRVVVFRTV